MGKNLNRKKSKGWPEGITFREAVGCIVALGFLTVFIIMALRLPPDNLLEVFRTAASPLALVIGALFGASRAKDDKDDKSKMG